MTYAKLKELSSEAFRRYSGVKPETFRAMLEVLGKAEWRKKKAGRPSKLALEDQLLLTLSYWREYRTQFHIASSYGVHETTATRIIGKIEDALIASGRFSLTSKQLLGVAEHEWVMVLIDSTETPIERPQKTAPVLQQRLGQNGTCLSLKSSTYRAWPLPGLSARKSATP